MIVKMLSVEQNIKSNCQPFLQFRNTIIIKPIKRTLIILLKIIEKNFGTFRHKF